MILMLPGSYLVLDRLGDRGNDVNRIRTLRMTRGVVAMRTLSLGIDSRETR